MVEHGDKLAETHCYITTSSGRRLTLNDLHVRDVDLRDVVHALAMQCRFNGHVRQFYSVAEHSVLVCSLAERDTGVGSEEARAALLHDAVEAYVGDFPSPLKQIVPGYKEFETKCERVVLEALRLPPKADPIWAQVKPYDALALHIEGAQLFTPPPPWVQQVDPKHYSRLHLHGPEDAERALTWKLRDYGYEV